MGPREAEWNHKHVRVLPVHVQMFSVQCFMKEISSFSKYGLCANERKNQKVVGSYRLKVGEGRERRKSFLARCVQLAPKAINGYGSIQNGREKWAAVAAFR